MSTQNQATRTEKDTMGNVEVPADAYWGAQTQRSRENFKIGGETLPRPMIEAMALVKKAAAITKATSVILSYKPLTKSSMVVWSISSHWLYGRQVLALSQT